MLLLFKCKWFLRFLGQTRQQHQRQTETHRRKTTVLRFLLCFILIIIMGDEGKARIT